MNFWNLIGLPSKQDYETLQASLAQQNQQQQDILLQINQLLQSMQKEQADAQDLILDELSKVTSHITQTADANSEIINATLEQHMKQLSGIKQSVNSHIEQSETNLLTQIEQLQTDARINQGMQEKSLHEIDSLFTMLKSIWMNELSGYMETLAGNHAEESRFYRYRYVTCPVCHARCQISEEKQETEIRCPQCGIEFEVSTRIIRIETQD